MEPSGAYHLLLLYHVEVEVEVKGDMNVENCASEQSFFMMEGAA